MFHMLMTSSVAEHVRKRQIEHIKDDEQSDEGEHEEQDEHGEDACSD